MDKSNCQVCHSQKSDIKTEDRNTRHYKVTCPTCGIYYFIDPVYKVKVMNETEVGLSSEELKKLSFLLRHNYEFSNPVTLTFDNIQQLVDDFNPTNDLIERIELLILYVYKSLKHPTDSVDIRSMPSIVYCDNINEFLYYLSEAKDLGLLKSHTNTEVKLTPRGWVEVKSILEKQVDSKKAFVAMWFDNEVVSAWEDSFLPALNELGYDPLRIDKKRA